MWERRDTIAHASGTIGIRLPIGLHHIWRFFHSGERMEQVWACASLCGVWGVPFLRNGSIGSSKVVANGLKYTSIALNLGL